MSARVTRGAESRTLDVFGFDGRKVLLWWPSTGAVPFSLVDGAGPGGWRIDAAELPALREAEHQAFASKRPDRVQRAHHAALWNDRDTPGRRYARRKVASEPELVEALPLFAPRSAGLCTAYGKKGRCGLEAGHEGAHVRHSHEWGAPKRRAGAS